MKTYLIEQVLALPDPFCSTCFVPWAKARIDLTVTFYVSKFQILLLDKCRDLFKLVVRIIGVVEEDAVEDLSQMAVKVLWDVAADVFGFS